MKNATIKMILLALVLQVALIGCDTVNVSPGEFQDGDTNSVMEGEIGSLKMAVTVSSGELVDVDGIRFNVMPLGGGPVIESQYSALAEGFIPSSLIPGEGTGDHRYSDSSFQLIEGEYTVTATALTDGEVPFEGCSIAQTNVVVDCNVSKEIVLVLQCSDGQTGGVDLVGTLNLVPVITSVDIGPGRSVEVGDMVSIDIAAEDPEGEEISYTWSWEEMPEDANCVLNSNGDSATFVCMTAGLYYLRVTVADPQDGENCLVIPFNVTDPEFPCIDCVWVDGVSVQPDSIELLVGGEAQLNAVVQPENAIETSVEWTSSDTDIVTVDANGFVTAVSPGHAVVTVTTIDGGFEAKSIVTVYVPVVGVDVIPAQLSVQQGAFGQLRATVYPANATSPGVKWETSNAAVAKVDSDGLVTGVSAGQAVIKAITVDGLFEDESVVTVYVPVTRVDVEPAQMVIQQGNTGQLNASIVPANATKSGVEWTTSNPAVAQVESNGLVTGVGPGQAVIKAIAMDGAYEASSIVTVYVSLTGVTVEPDELLLLQGTFGQLTAGVIPVNASSAGLQWSSSNSAVATVAADGLVAAVGPGQAIIKVASPDGQFEAGSLITVRVPVAGVAIEPAELAVKQGTTDQLSAVVTPANATGGDVVWTSSNTGVATVDATGVVTGVGPGQTVIKAVTVDGGFEATCPVSVYVSVTGVAVSPAELSIEQGKFGQLNATVSPANATGARVEWTSSNTGVATVNSNGLVTGVGPGQAVIKAVTVDGGFEALSQVTVYASVTGVTITPAELFIEMGSVESLNAIVAPANATVTGVVWSSSNTGVATVDANGQVTAIGPGQALVKVTTVDGGFEATTPVTVHVPVTGVSVTPAEIRIEQGKLGQLKATVTPANATGARLEWTSSNASVATVNSSGMVTAVGPGQAVVKAATLDGGFEATALVTVYVSVTGVTVEPSELFVELGSTGGLSATVAPANATVSGVEWTSLNTGVATVDGAGVVTGVGSGQAVVKAVTVDGGFEAVCQVTVSVPVTGVQVTPTELSIEQGKFGQLQAGIFPANATGARVEWVSLNTEVATVNANGLVTGVGPGEAVVKAVAGEGAFEATARITVFVNVAGVVVEPTELFLELDGTGNLSAAVLPANASVTGVEWISLNTDVATVDATGLVVAMGPGQAVVKAVTVDGEFEASAIITVHVPVTGVTLTPVELFLVRGKTSKLNAAVTPANATGARLEWTSSDPAVATVDSAGLVTGVGAGQAVIKAVTVDGGFEATTAVTVYVAVTGVNVEPVDLVMAQNATARLSATINPADATDSRVEWTTSNADVATVDSTGLVTGVGAGVASIKAVSVEGGHEGSSKVTVYVPVTGVSVEPADMVVALGKTGQLSATVSPANATDTVVSWTTSDAAVASVNSRGVVTGVGPGQAVIKAVTAEGEFSATSLVTVRVPVTGVVVEPSELVVDLGGTGQLSAAVIPANATESGVNWSSSNTAVATVDANGGVVGVKGGVAMITVTTLDGSYSETATITVFVHMSDLSLDETELTLQRGSKVQLTATITPADTTNQTLTWTSSRVGVASVGQDGMVVAIDPGVTVITVASEDGAHQATCTVHVTGGAKVTDVALNDGPLELIKGSYYHLKATISPPNAENPKLKWSSSDTNVVTVEQNGLVTAVNEGEAVVTVVTLDGEFTDTCFITVFALTAVEGLSVFPDKLVLEVGSTGQFETEIVPEDASNQDLIYRSYHTDVVTIDESGLITALAEGRAVISIITDDGGIAVTREVVVIAGVEDSDWVLLDAATFMMGSPTTEKGRTFNEHLHEVVLQQSFIMSATVVTQGEYSSLMGTNPSRFKACGDDCPVEMVKWYDAIAYANAVSIHSDLEVCYQNPSGGDYDAKDAKANVEPVWTRGLDCEGYRLPTEAEWEYAARAGTTTPFHTGDFHPDESASGCKLVEALDASGHYCGNSSNSTSPVALKEPNAWGIYDVHGNVWEWVWDKYGEYETGVVSVDPLGAENGAYRVVRGGSWSNTAGQSRAAFRNYANGDGRNNSLGIRLVRTVN